MVAHSSVRLRPVVDEDIGVFYEHQADPEASAMAVFGSRDRDAHFAHWARIRADPTDVLRTIEYDGVVVGNVVSWVADGYRMVGYWIDRAHWGRGIATAALTQFVAELRDRPLRAWVVKSNLGSIRVLEKTGFEVVEERTAPGPGGDVREYVMELRDR